MNHANKPAKKRWPLYALAAFVILLVMAGGTWGTLQLTREGLHDTVTYTPDADIHAGDIVHSQADYHIGNHMRSWEAVATNDGLKLAPILTTDQWQHCNDAHPNKPVYQAPDEWVERHIDLALTANC